MERLLQINSTLEHTVQQNNLSKNNNLSLFPDSLSYYLVIIYSFSMVFILSFLHLKELLWILMQFNILIMSIHSFNHLSLLWSPSSLSILVLHITSSILLLILLFSSTSPWSILFHINLQCYSHLQSIIFLHICCLKSLVIETRWGN